jgi:hypothetical protein
MMKQGMGFDVSLRGKAVPLRNKLWGLRVYLEDLLGAIDNFDEFSGACFLAI